MQKNLENLIVRMRQGGILYSEAVPAFKRAFISAVLRANNGNLSRTARSMGLHRNTLARICSELELDAREFRVGRRPSVVATRLKR